MIEVRWIQMDQPSECRPLSTRMPLERALVLFYLEPDALYSPAEAAGTFYPVSSEEYLRARRAFSKLAANNNFEEAFDNTDKNDSEPRRWYGSSWVLCLGPEYLYFIAKLMDELKVLQETEPGPYFLDGDKLVKAKPQRVRKKRSAKAKKGADSKDESDPLPAPEPPTHHQDPIILLAEEDAGFDESDQDSTTEAETDRCDGLSSVYSTEKAPPSYLLLKEEKEGKNETRPGFLKSKHRKGLFLGLILTAILASAVVVLRPKPIEDPYTYILDLTQNSPEKVLAELKKMNKPATQFAQELFLNNKGDPFKWFKNMMRIDPKNEISYLFSSAALHFANGEMVKSHQELSYLLTRKDVDAITEIKATYLAGCIHESLGDVEQAVKYLKACQLKAKSTKDIDMETLALNELAMIAIHQSDYEQAEEYLSLSLANGPKQVKQKALQTRTNLTLGFLKMYILDFDQALQLFRGIYLTKDIDNPEIRVMAECFYALILTFKGKINEAAEHAKLIEAYIEENPSSEERLIGYLNVIWISINQCQHFQTKEAEEEHIKWAHERDKGNETIKLLEFVKQRDCNQNPKMPGREAKSQ